MTKTFFKMNKSRGFTIIETMIAISLFLIVIMTGMGALLNTNLLHEKSQNTRDIMDNLSFVMEDMSRNLRTGYSYQCFSQGQTLSPGSLSTPRSCAAGWAIAFEYQEGNPATYGDQWVYYISNDGKIFKSTDGANTFTQMTPDEIVIDPRSFFKVEGAEPPPGDSRQPFVTIKLIGKLTFKNVETPFSLQTSISQRQIDNVSPAGPGGD